MTAPVREFDSHIDGANAKIRIFDDRLEYSSVRGMSAAKITTGLMTGGTSLLATGFRKKGASGSTSIPLGAVSSVSTARDGMRYSNVLVASGTGLISFRVSHGEAQEIAQLLNRLVAQRR
jgi:hypothetical protein